MKGALVNTGTILVKTLKKVSTNRVVIQDLAYLETVLEGALSSPEVVYALVRDHQGHVLVQKSKGELEEGRQNQRKADRPIFPDRTLTNELWEEQHPQRMAQPVITVWHTSDLPRRSSPKSKQREQSSGDRIRTFETLYDFALPIYRPAKRSSALELLSSETLEESVDPSNATPRIIGVLQVGLTTTTMQQSLAQTVWDIGILTGGMILLGIVLTLWLANRIVNPLQGLVRATQKIAGGNLRVQVQSDSQDEVGQLTTSIDQMVKALQQREQDIALNMSTITKQVTQLNTLHQTGAVITATLDVQKLFAIVLKLLQENLGFQRMVLVLLSPSDQQGIISQVAGVPTEIEGQLMGQTFSIIPGTLDETLLVQGEPVLAPTKEVVVDRMNPLLLSAARELDFQSFVGAPLISHQRILGYLGAEKGAELCTAEDVELLKTIASHVAVAIDNARTYQDLEALAQTLEQRVEERTHDLQSANERLQELDTLKSAFVSIVSHELRTPMTSIKGLVENMMDGLTGTLTTRQTFYLARVQHNIDRLTRMINDLLDLSRIEAGRMELHRQGVHIGSIAREVVELLQPLAQQHALTLRTTIQDSLPLIQGDRDKLIQIFTNLMNNAIKFTPPAGTVGVEVNYHPDGMIYVCVTDTGYGIHPDEQRSIFERFYRSQSADLKNQGAGLGLAITKSLVEMHGGRIWVESTLGEGSQFWFTLPVEIQPSSKSQKK